MHEDYRAIAQPIESDPHNVLRLVLPNPIEAGRRPLDGAQSVLAQDLKESEPSSPIRRSEKPWPRASQALNGGLGAIDFLSHLFPALEVEKWMGEGVIANCVLLSQDAPPNLRITLNVLATYEKSSRNAVVAKDIENLTGIRLGGSVVKGQNHTLTMGRSPHESRSKNLRTGN